VSREVCEKHRIIPVSRSGASLVVAMADPTNLHAIDDIKFLTGLNVEPVVASETAIVQALERVHTTQGPSYDEMLSEFGGRRGRLHGRDDDVNLPSSRRPPRARPSCASSTPSC
jgi:type IV pilus assembly protein PilB